MKFRYFSFLFCFVAMVTSVWAGDFQPPVVSDAGTSVVFEDLLLEGSAVGYTEDTLSDGTKITYPGINIPYYLEQLCYEMFGGEFELRLIRRYQYTDDKPDEIRFDVHGAWQDRPLAVITCKVCVPKEGTPQQKDANSLLQVRDEIKRVLKKAGFIEKVDDYSVDF